jgi:AraC-like DNA-binding protein
MDSRPECNRQKLRRRSSGGSLQVQQDLAVTSFQSVSGPLNQSTDNRSMDPRITVVLRIIQERNGQIYFPMPDVLAVLGISHSHLLRLFKQELGITFRQHLRNVRMLAAAHLLSSPSTSVKAAAVASGYSDLSNFYRDFKRVHEITPCQWRLQCLTHLSESHPLKH